MTPEIITLIIAIATISIGLISKQIKTGERIATLETKMELFWKSISLGVTELVKSPTNLRKDYLLDTMNNGDLDYEGALELQQTLYDEYHKKDLDSSRKLAYALIMGRLEIKIYELKKRK